MSLKRNRATKPVEYVPEVLNDLSKLFRTIYHQTGMSYPRLYANSLKYLRKQPDCPTSPDQVLSQVKKLMRSVTVPRMTYPQFIKSLEICGISLNQITVQVDCDLAESHDISIKI